MQRTKLPIISFLVLFGGILAFAYPASAHTTGASFETPIDGYTSDIGYDTLVFQQGQSSSFNFTLWDGATTSGEIADYAQVWIRIVHDQQTYLATGLLKQSIGPTTLLYAFPAAGDYTLEASYRDADGNDVAVAQIPLTVTKADGGTSVYLLYALCMIIGLLIGSGAAFFVLQKAYGSS